MKYESSNKKEITTTLEINRFVDQDMCWSIRGQLVIFITVHIMEVIDKRIIECGVSNPIVTIRYHQRW